MRYSKILVIGMVVITCARSIYSMQGGRIDGSMAREGIGFHTYHGGMHRSIGGYSGGRAYGAYGRHFGQYGHRGYARYGDQAYVRKEAKPVVENNPEEMNRSIGAGREGNRPRRIQADRGGNYWGYYNSPDWDGEYPWNYYGLPHFNYRKGDYFPWYYGYNPVYLWY